MQIGNAVPPMMARVIAKAIKIYISWKLYNTLKN
jgi:site-specific DNA-cytosine methylase